MPKLVSFSLLWSIYLLSTAQKSKVGRQRKSNKPSLYKWENNIHENKDKSFKERRFLEYLWMLNNGRYQMGKKAYSINYTMLSLLCILGKIWRMKDWRMFRKRQHTHYKKQFLPVQVNSEPPCCPFFASRAGQSGRSGCLEFRYCMHMKLRSEWLT